MPPLSSLVLFAGSAVVLLVIPGPAVLYIVARSADQGRRAGLVSVAGIHTGTVVHVVAALAGLSALVVASAGAFTVVKFAGAAYLVHLGIKTLRDTATDTEDPEPLPLDGRPMSRVFRQAVVVNVLNPKTAVFFLAYLPQFVDPAAGNVTVQLGVLSGVFIGLGLLSDGIYALMGDWLGRRFSRSVGTRRRRRLVTGGTYMGLGVLTALAGGRGTEG
ncbi:MAG TPA: LysE family translocator [Acidimicrobiales bacterium]|nr:LysE family translocator [Acidimicrobiales bacterium]